MNEKAKKELTTKDQKVISKILSKSIEVLTKEEKGILSARRSYLTKEELKNFKIDGKSEVDENKEADDEEEATDYSGLKKGELIAECENRKIEVDKRATVAELVELLEADDNGELEDDEEEEK